MGIPIQCPPDPKVRLRFAQQHQPRGSPRTAHDGVVAVQTSPLSSHWGAHGGRGQRNAPAVCLSTRRGEPSHVQATGDAHWVPFLVY